MLIPSPVGIVGVFIGINLIATAILTNFLYNKLENKKWLYILIIPCCSFQVLLFNEYPLRCSIFGSFEIIAFIWIFELFYGNRTRGDIERIAIILVILATLRSETFFYSIVGIMVLLCLLKNKRIELIIAMRGILIIISGFIFVSAFQTNLTSIYGDRNTLTAIVDPLVEMTRTEAQKYTHWSESKELNKINEVISVEYIVDSTGKGAALMWQNGFFQEENPHIVDGFWKAYLRLLSDNFTVFLKERLETFKYVQKANVYEQSLISINLFSPENKLIEPMSLNLDLPGFRVFDFNLYVRALKILTMDFCDSNILRLFRILLNSIYIPAVGLLFLLIENISKRRFLFAGGITVLFLKALLIFLTMPGNAYMYYYPVYYVGWLCIFIRIMLKLDSRAANFKS